MKNKTNLALVQGIESIAVLKSFIDQNDIEVDHWVTYDVKSMPILQQFGISDILFDDSFEDNLELSEEINQLAHHFGESWFNKLNQEFPTKKNVEQYFCRLFTYSYSVVLKAYLLLEQLSKTYENGNIITTKVMNESGSIEALRWSQHETPVTPLLEEFGEKWGFKTRYVPMSQSQGSRKQGFVTKIVLKLGVFLSSFKGSQKIIFSGNPSLLRPVADRYHKMVGERPLWLREMTRLKEVGRSLQSDWFFVRNLEDQSKAAFISKEELQSYKEILKEDTVFYFKGKSLFPVFWNRIKHFYESHYGRALGLENELVKKIEKTKPEWVVVDEDVTPVRRMLITISKRMNIKTLVVIHGLPGVQLGFAPLASDYIAVWGNYFKERLAGWGIPEEKIIVTGCPKYEGLSREVEVDLKEKICHQFAWDDKRPVVLITPDGIRNNGLERHEGLEMSPTDLLDMTYQFIEFAKKYSNVNFIYKFHKGRWYPDFYEQMFGGKIKGLKNFNFVSDGSAIDYIKVSDFVFNGASSTILESIILKKPVATLRMSNLPRTMPYDRFGYKGYVKSFEEIDILCDQLAKGEFVGADWVEDQEQLLEPFLHHFDGQSSHRIAEMLRTSRHE